MKLRCDTCNGENEVDFSKDNICTICERVIDLKSGEIKDQLEIKGSLHLIASFDSATDNLDDLDLAWNKFKEYYLAIIIASVILVWCVMILMPNIYVLLAIVSVSLVLMSTNIAYFSYKISGKQINIAHAFLGVLTFNFPIGMMTIYFAVQNIYYKAKGRKVPNAQKTLVVVGVFMALLIYAAFLYPLLS